MFSNQSETKLRQCDKRLIELFLEVEKACECTILTGHRPEAEQNEAFRTGRSKVQYPDGKHNKTPSQAVDAAPYPIDWKDRERFTLFAGLVKGVAHARGIKIRWGGDWSGDWQVKDNGFDDLVHYEIFGE